MNPETLSRHRLLALVACLYASVQAPAFAGQCDIGSLTIDEPIAGALNTWQETQGHVRVCGTFEGPPQIPGKVELEVISSDLDCQIHACKYKIDIVAGEWCRDSVRVGWKAPTKLFAQFGECRDTIYLTCCPGDLSPRETQTFGLSWEGVDGMLRAIGRDTLNVLPVAQEQGFPGEVRRRVQKLLDEWTEPFDVTRVDLNALYHLKFTTDTDGLWGWTRGQQVDDNNNELAGDCGNHELTGESKIHVGSFAESMKQERLLWWPMSKQDSYDIRVEDVARVLASTALHELMHGMGLVTCGWMSEDSQDAGHNDRSLHGGTRGIPNGGGWHLMDSGTRTYGYQLLGFDSADPLGRNIRRQRILAPTNLGYLRALHP